MVFNKAVLFDTQDLFEGKDMVKVINNLEELSRRAAKKGLASIEGAGDAPAAAYSPPPRAADPAPAPAAAAAPAAGGGGGGGGEVCGDCGSPRVDGAAACGDCGAAFP